MNILYVNSLEANNKELARQLASANVLIAEQNKLGKERQEWALHTNEVIRSLNQQLADALLERDAIKREWDKAYEIAMLKKQQLAAALAACQQKDEALKWLMDWQVKHVDVWDNPAFDNAEEALTIQPDDDALNAWLGEPIGEVKKHTGSLKDMAIIVWSGEQPAEGTKLYSPKGLK